MMEMYGATLRPLTELAGKWGFVIWGLGTEDSLEQLLKPGYLRTAGQALRTGDLVFAQIQPHKGKPDELPQHHLLAVVKDEQGQVSLRRMLMLAPEGAERVTGKDTRPIRV